MRNFKQRLRNLLRHFKVGTRLSLFLSFALILILTTTILIAQYFSTKIANQYIYEYLQTEHLRVSNNIELYLEEIIMVSLRYKNTSELYDIMLDDKLSLDKKKQELQTVAGSIQSSANNSISNVYLIDYKNNIYPLNNSNSELSMPNTSSLSHVKGTPYYQVEAIIKDRDGNTYIPLSMEFRNFYTGQAIGYLIFYLPERPIAKLYQSLLPSDGFSFIVDLDENIISHNTQDLIGSLQNDYDIYNGSDRSNISYITMGGDRFVLVSTNLNNDARQIGFSWRLVSVLPYHDLYQILDQVLVTLLITGFVVILFAILISIIISTRLTRPLHRLQLKLQDLANGRLDSFVTNHPNDEIWELEEGYNDMVIRINELINTNKQEQEKKRELEFTALQAQINPHFLYNTLDAIGWIARLKEQDEIERMVMELSRFFRLTLHRGEDRISIEDEIGIANSYIAIEQLRNPGKFDVEYEIQLDIHQILVPKIILQPVVENAIKHGISQVRRHGQLIIKGYRNEDDVYLEVIDNGAGFTAKDGAPPTSYKGSSYGLKNVKERLQLEYGEKYGIDIWSEPGEGTRVRLHLRIPEEVSETDD
ncbi:MAG: signal transduction histidine kinase, LytS [Anaerocolumna sp.]|nr:signal transduction histidine kinase, LytS [Anaerocolumna sp.]